MYAAEKAVQLTGRLEARHAPVVPVGQINSPSAAARCSEGGWAGHEPTAAAYHTTSSSDRIDGRGPLRQPSPGVSTTASPRPLGTNAKRCDVLSVIWWSHELRGRPVRRRQPGRQEPVRIVTTCDHARWAGVWSSNLTTWPNSEFRLLVMMSLIQGRLICWRLLYFYRTHKYKWSIITARTLSITPGLSWGASISTDRCLHGSLTKAARSLSVEVMLKNADTGHYGGGSSLW